MKTYLLIYILSLVSVLAMGQSGSITNITASQRTDGSMVVDIYYDLSGSDPEYYVTAQVSFDGGLSFENMNATSEDIGEGVNPGNGKHIEWHFGYQFPNQSVSNARIKLTAAYPKPWQCGDVLVDSRDGQSYNTKKIGGQCWMADNLNIGTYVPISVNQSNNLAIEKHCFGDDINNCTNYGGLYRWLEAMDYATGEGVRGICPVGWHIPSNSSWNTLVSYLGGESVAGQKMKIPGTLYWYPPNPATNESGFGAKGGGQITNGALWYAFKTFGAFWSSSTNQQYNLNNYYLLHNGYESISLMGSSPGYEANSIRCIRNWNEPPAMPINPSPASGSTGQPLNGTLTWDCTDPDGDPLIYDVYFGTTNPPAIHTAGLTNEEFNPGTLSPNTTYYWKVLAFDTDGQTNLGTTVWSFTTQ